MAEAVEAPAAPPTKTAEAAAAVERSWARVATHLEAAIAALPRPNWRTITNPKEMAKSLKALYKSLKQQLKDVLRQSKDMCARVYALLSQLASKLAELISTFYQYICDKVKSFFKWISGLVQSFKAKLMPHRD